MNLQPHLWGNLVELRPLQPEDWGELFAVASDPLIWEQHPASDRYREDVFREFFDGALRCGGGFVVIDKSTGKVIGSTRYYAYDPQKREVEIGWTFLDRSHWGGRFNGEMKRLMLDHAFQFVDTVIFLVGSTNVRSQKAVERIGAVKTGQREANLNGRIVEHWIYELAKPVSAAR